MLLCNKTNAASIAEFTGTRDYSQWPGKTVWLIRSRTDFRGQSVECIRIELSPPARPATQLVAPAPVDVPQADPGGFRAEVAAMPVGVEDTPF